ncbi:MAG: GNAT family N-acetyltransferase [Pseudomonadota bacterium]
MNYEIVSITEKHIDGFWRAVDSVAKEELYIAFLEAPPIEKTQSYIFEQLQNNMPHYIALVNGDVVGWCDISSKHRPVFVHSGILGMGLISQYRGKGIGRAMMQVTLSKAKEIGLTRVELEVREKNARAIELYKKFGFIVEGIKRNSTKVNGVYENDLVMGLLLES